MQACVLTDTSMVYYKWKYNWKLNLARTKVQQHAPFFNFFFFFKYIYIYPWYITMYTTFLKLIGVISNDCLDTEAGELYILSVWLRLSS